METFLPFLLGSTIKAYDDIVDENKKVSEFTHDILKGLIICIFVLIAHNDSTFSIITALCLLTSYFYSGVDNSFWLSFSCIAVFMLFISILMGGINLGKNIILIPFYIFTALGIYLEARTFPEEKSTNKTLFRLIFVCLMFILQIYNSILTPRKFLNFVIGYFLTSVTNIADIIEECHLESIDENASSEKKAAEESDKTIELVKSEENNDTIKEEESPPTKSETTEDIQIDVKE